MRVVLAILLAVAVFLLLPSETSLELRVIASWNAGVILLLSLIAMMMARSDPEQTFRRAQEQEPSNALILLITLLASLAGYIAIAFGLRAAADMSHAVLGVHTVLSITAVFTSWLLIHTYYAVQYAVSYYDETDDASNARYKKGLQFPGDKELVDYWDFMYYSFTIAMCYQTSDVTVVSPSMRRLTLVHSIVSFFFVLAGLGLMVNIISNFI